MGSCDEFSDYTLTSLCDPLANMEIPMEIPTRVVDTSPVVDYGVAATVPPPSLYYNSIPAGESSSNSHSDSSQPKASDRESRIKAEKQRRDQYNDLINELQTLLPAIIHSQRKIDKTSVLRLAANELRNVHVFGDSVKCNHIERWSKVMQMFDLFGGFLITVTCRGRICNVSPNVQSKLGHNHIDLLGQNFYEFVHPDDRELLRQQIYPAELHVGCDNNAIYEEHHDFSVRIMRAGSRSDPPRYEQCRIDGTLRRSDHATSNGVQDEQIIRRQRVRHNRTFSSSGNDFVFIGMARIESQTRPITILPPTAHSEYWTRHLIDGRIVQVDQSISLVAGYMTEEVTGTSAFFFMHKEDVRWVICVLRQMYDQSKEFGESYYRLMSRTGEFLYMRTRGFLEIDSTTKQVQSFVCMNSVIGEDFGKKMLDEMKRKYSVIVDKSHEVATSVSIDSASVEHPQHLERIVMHLVQPSHSELSEPLKIIPPSKDNIITAIKNSEKVVLETGISFGSRKRKIVDIDVTSNKKILRQSCLK